MRRLFSLAPALLLSANALAVPALWNHQGRVLDATGVPLDGPHALTVTLWGTAAGGETPLWTETQELTVDNGYYSHMK